MPRVRMNVHQLPQGDTTLPWYAKAVEAMRARPCTDPRSWHYQAAIHGFDPGNAFWAGVGALPGAAEQSQYWNQCQHGSWFFLPWHRMYLAYFEQIVADTIVALGGPADWALPFWDYCDTASQPMVLTMPPAFTAGTPATNALRMPPAGSAPGRFSDTVNPADTVVNALDTPIFAGAWRGAAQGFGGPVTTFSHSAGIHGELENLPHDFIHVDIGGAMGDPDTAALDPIFWLHHANIDRLWQVWLNRDPAHSNPVNPNWRDCPFDFHNSDGAPESMTPAQVLDTVRVLSGYVYQGVPATAPGLIPQQAAALFAAAANELAPEILAANNGAALLGAQPVSATLDFLPADLRRASLRSASALATFAAAGVPAPAAGQVFLNFENITGSGIPPVYDVHVAAARGGSHHAGSLAFFGVASSSRPGTHNDGSGQHYILDISALRRQMERNQEWDDQRLQVRLTPRREPAPGTAVRIGRISLYVR